LQGTVSISGENILIIDAEAQSFDYLSEIPISGDISRALNGLSLHNFRQVSPSPPQRNFLLRHDTAGHNCRRINGMIFEINEYKRQFEEKYKDGKVIITGGDSGYLSGKITGEVIFLPDIVIEGLNQLLEYNAEKA
jgi:type III pantothenate kinase